MRPVGYLVAVTVVYVAVTGSVFRSFSPCVAFTWPVTGSVPLFFSHCMALKWQGSVYVVVTRSLRPTLLSGCVALTWQLWGLCGCYGVCIQLSFFRGIRLGMRGSYGTDF